MILLHALRLGEDDMFQRFSTTTLCTAILLIHFSALSPCASRQASVTTAGSGPINCRVMEAFEEAKLGVRAIIFHQRDKADGPRLGALLLAHTGEEMELQTAGGQSFRATVFRVKSAFGRGLVLIPVSNFRLAEHEEFILRLPAKH